MITAKEIIENIKNETNWVNQRMKIDLDGICISEQSTILEEIKSILVNMYEKNNKSYTISISNIASNIICNCFDLDPTEFNGWQCDWWDNFYYNGHEITVSGCAWYATAELNIN